MVSEGGGRGGRGGRGGGGVWARPNFSFLSPGKLTPHLAKLRRGDTLDIKGPMLKTHVSPTWRHVGLVAGGTGITPMLQVLHAALAPSSTCKAAFTLVYGSVTPGDVICKKEMDALAAAHPDRLKVVYTVDAAPARGWPGSVGRIDRALLARTLPPPSPDVQVLVCGPGPMVKAVCGDKAEDKSQGPLDGHLKAMGYDATMVFKF